MNASKTAAAPTHKPLRWPEIAAFGAGDFGYCLYWKMFEMYLLIFYTDIFGIPAVTAGTMIMVTRVLDAAIDPFLGIVADRTNTRFGKFRPYVLASAIPLAVLGVMTFTTPNLSPSSKVVWAYATYMATMLAYTLGNIPYGAMLGVITNDVKKRSTLSTTKLVGANVGGVFVALFTQDLVEFFGAGNKAQGWQFTMIAYAVLSIVLIVITFAFVTERVRPSPTQKTSAKQDVADLFRNGPWMLLFVIGFIVMLTIAIRGGTTAFLFKYYMNREDLTKWGLITTTVPLVIGAALTPFYLRFFTKKQLFTICMLVVGALCMVVYFIKPQNVTAMLALSVAISFALGPKAPLTWAMYADSADFSEWKNGRRATALIFSAATFGVKFGGAVAQAIVAFLLSLTGYIPNQLQTADALHGILILSSIIPGVCALLSAGVIQLYKLDADKLDTIQKELQDRRVARGEA